jgi:DNA-binding CsgD family transcriptional regulator
LEQAVEEAEAITDRPAADERSAPEAGPAATARLTRREREILGHLAANRTDAEIAGILFLSVRTVEHHVAHVLAKLGVRTRTAATTAARDAGVVPPKPPPPE